MYYERGLLYRTQTIKSGITAVYRMNFSNESSIKRVYKEIYCIDYSSHLYTVYF